MYTNNKHAIYLLGNPVVVPRRWELLRQVGKDSLSDAALLKLRTSITQGTTHRREGVFNGSCEQKYRKCNFWTACKANNPDIAAIILKSDFNQRQYNPLKHNE